MTREEQLMQEYEDVTFRILMDRVAQSEGKKALEENERLLADPAAAVPEAVERRAHKTIQRMFDQHKKEHTHHSLRKAWKIAVIAAIFLALMVTVVFAASPAIRAKTYNMVKNVYETHTDFTFPEDYPVSQELEINTGWIPDGFQLQDEGAIKSYSWEIYENGPEERILVEKSYPYETSIDTENAEITAVTVQGFDATLITKDKEARIIWLNTDCGIVYYIGTEGISSEELLRIAENIS